VLHSGPLSRRQWQATHGPQKKVALVESEIDQNKKDAAMGRALEHDRFVEAMESFKDKAKDLTDDLQKLFSHVEGEAAISSTATLLTPRRRRQVQSDASKLWGGPKRGWVPRVLWRCCL
jgi:hypothetical protein